MFLLAKAMWKTAKLGALCALKAACQHPSVREGRCIGLFGMIDVKNAR